MQMSDKSERQNEAIIALLARTAIGVDTIFNLVCGGKRDPEAYRKVYNALQGTLSVTEVAKLAGVRQQTMSEVLQSWEEQGIVYNAGTDRKPQYHRLLHLPRTKRKRSEASSNE